MNKDVLPATLNARVLAVPFLISLVLIALSQVNFLAFHTVVELFSAIIGIVVFVIAWNSYPVFRNDFLLFLGCGLFWISCLDLAHAMLFEGLNITQYGASEDASIQFWVVARIGEALLFLSLPFIGFKSLGRKTIFAFMGVASLLAALAIFGGWLPVAYQQGVGVTVFKVGSEVFAAGALVVAAYVISKRNNIADEDVYRFLMGAVFVTIITDIAAAWFLSPNAWSNIAAHISKFVAFWLIYLAFGRALLAKPLSMFSRRSSTYDVIPSATIVVDRNGIIQQVNSAASMLAQMQAEQVIGKSSHEIFHPNNLSEKECPLCQHIADGEGLNGFEMEFPERGLWREFTLTPLKIDHAVVGVVQVVVDITERYDTQEALRNSEKKYRDFVENLQGDLFFFSYDLDFELTYISPSIQRVLGYDADEFALYFEQHLREEIKKINGLAIGKKLTARGKASFSPVFEMIAIHKNGEQHYLEISESPVLDRQNRLLAIEAIAYDVTKRKQTEESLRSFNQQLRMSQQRLALHVEQTPLAVIEFDMELNIRSWNASATRIFGFKDDEVLGKPVDMLLSESSRAYGKHLRKMLLSQHKGFRVTQQNRTKDSRHIICEWYNTPLANEHGQTIGMASLVNDVTERELAEARLLQQANFDALTNLPNRMLALDRLKQAIRVAHRQSRAMALMFVDLDYFKNVNDTLGHAVGDRLLIAVARKLVSAVRDGDTVARLGGDEFLVILPGLSRGAVDAESVAEKILSAVGKPILIEDREFHIGASIGITMYPSDATEPDQLLRNADTAMYQAKANGRNDYRFYTASMNEDALRRLEMETQLRYAISRNELQVYFQPQIGLQMQTVVGAEALLRWSNVQYGDIEPQQFIPLAETCGLINEIGTWVMELACREAVRWQAIAEQPVRVSINVSPRQLKDKQFFEKLSRTLSDTGLNPMLLELEVTESLLLEDAPETYNTLQRIKSMGIRLALDDFGTGYSSLGYLKRFPFNALKIDRSFVTDISTDPSDAALCQAIIAMAGNLDLEVIGEGAETQQQTDFLKTHGANAVQGYYFSEPLPPERFCEYLQRATETKALLAS